LIPAGQPTDPILGSFLAKRFKRFPPHRTNPLLLAAVLAPPRDNVALPRAINAFGVGVGYGKYSSASFTYGHPATLTHRLMTGIGRKYLATLPANPVFIHGVPPFLAIYNIITGMSSIDPGYHAIAERRIRDEQAQLRLAL
jgi:hypothetical protein